MFCRVIVDPLTQRYDGCRSKALGVGVRGVDLRLPVQLGRGLAPRMPRPAVRVQELLEPLPDPVALGPGEEPLVVRARVCTVQVGEVDALPTRQSGAGVESLNGPGTRDKTL